MEQNKEIAYIAKRYRSGKFVLDSGWNRLQIAPSVKTRRMRIAASITGLIVISAAAAMIYLVRQPQPSPQPQQTRQTVKAEKYAVKTIDFENTPLPTVISKINEVYGVEVENIPENASDFRISLHYEGNAVDLVATINDILNTQMNVKE